MTRGKGEGSIFKRASDGMYCYQLSLTRMDGSRYRPTIARASKKALMDCLETEVPKLRRRAGMPSDVKTVAEWFEYWLTREPEEVRPKTFKGYESVIRNHIVPVIGKVKLDRLSQTHVRRVTDKILDAWVDDDDHDKGKKYKSTYALNAHRIMSTSFTDALQEGRIDANPAKMVKAPRKSATDLPALLPEDAIRLVRTFGETPSAFLWATFLLTGARRGEVLGLEWDRIGEVIEFSWQLQRHTVGKLVAPADYEYRQLTDGLYLTRPKSHAGWRIVPLVDPLRAILERWRTLADTNPYGLVFTTADGQPIDPDRATKQWPLVLEAAGIHENVVLHGLRHTTIDLLDAAGVDTEIAMQIVGHSTRAQTNAYKSKTRRNRPQLKAAMLQLSDFITPQESDRSTPN